jgi:hypothetical protein
VQSAVWRVLTEHAVALGVPGLSLPPAKVAESRNRMRDLFAPRQALLSELVAATRNVFEQDLDPVDRYTKPALGYLHVSPAFNWGCAEAHARLRATPTRWRIWISSVGGTHAPRRGAYLANYMLVLEDHPSTVGIIREIEAYEAHLEQALQTERQWWIDHADVMDH